MATKTAAKTAAKTAPVPAAKTAAPAAAAPGFDWDSLPDAVVPTYTRNASVPKNVEENTPEPIKAKLRESYAAYVPASVDENGKKTAPKLSWREQECGTEERAQEFVKLAKRYAKGSDPRMTLRSAIVESSITGKNTIVRFMAKPFEARDNG